MPTVISGPRRARSFVTPAGNEVVQRVLDFNFAATQGIQIEAVLGSLSVVDLSPAVSDTVPADLYVSQSLHLEEGTIENIPFLDGEDADEIDSEVFYLDHAQGQFQTGTTNTFGAGGNAGHSSLYVAYRDPILVARNISHRGEGRQTGQVGKAHVVIYYRYVQFSTQELGLIFARRD